MSRARSALPAELRAALCQVGEKLEKRQSIGSEFRIVLQGFSQVQASLVTRAEPEIVEAARLFRWAYGSPVVVRWLGLSLTDQEQLLRVPGLEFLFLFHRDGHIREAALRKIAEPIPSAFLFVAIAWRLNDWVAQVRAAAAECATRVFPLTEPAVIAEAATVLLRRDGSWGRWGPERHLLDKTIARPDVTEKLADILATRVTGPSATILRYALRSTSMDTHLMRLARDAVQPAVRAVAAQALIDGFTSWPSGWRWRWIDRSMFRRKRETVLEKRALTVRTDRLGQIKAGLGDSSARVRNAAISGLIRYRDDIGEVRQLVEPLLNDRSRGVREMALFLLRPS